LILQASIRCVFILVKADVVVVKLQKLKSNNPRQFILPVLRFVLFILVPANCIIAVEELSKHHPSAPPDNEKKKSISFAVALMESWNLFFPSLKFTKPVVILVSLVKSSVDFVNEQSCPKEIAGIIRKASRKCFIRSKYFYKNKKQSLQNKFLNVKNLFIRVQNDRIYIKAPVIFNGSFCAY